MYPPSSRRRLVRSLDRLLPLPHAASPGRRRSSPARPNERSSSRGGCAGWGGSTRDPSSSRGDRVLDLSRLASRDRGRDRPRSSFLSLLLLLLLLLDEEWDLRLRLRCLRCFRCFRSFLSLLSRLSLFSLLLRLRLRLEDRDRESVRETDRCFRSFLSLLCRFSLFSLLLRLRLRLEERDRESVRETDRERPISFPRARRLCPPPQRRIVRPVDPLFAKRTRLAFAKLAGTTA